MALLRVFNESDKYRDGRALSDVLRYCTQMKKTNPDLCGGWAVNPENAAEEMETFSQLANKADGVRLRHFEISFPPEEVKDLELVAKIARECAEYYAADHQIVYAVHEDKTHRHAHFVMNSVRYSDGNKYRGTKKDLYDFEEYCKAVFHKNGLAENLRLVKDSRNRSN